MEHSRFGEILDAQLQRIRDILEVKQDEYGTEDYLHNIRAAALLEGASMPQSVVTKMSKHTVSIFTMVKGGKPHLVDKWDEKITDHIVWLILLKAALIEGAENPLKE